MYYKLNEEELEEIKYISKITSTDYELKGNFIPVESLISAIEDLILEIYSLNKKIEDMKKDIEENYKLKDFDPYDEYGISERDFH